MTNVSRPRLITHKPLAPNGTAVLVISGGGYAHIELGKESTPTAIWLQSLGVTAFELVLPAAAGRVDAGGAVPGRPTGHAAHP